MFAIFCLVVGAAIFCAGCYIGYELGREEERRNRR